MAKFQSLSGPNCKEDDVKVNTGWSLITTDGREVPPDEVEEFLSSRSKSEHEEEISGDGCGHSPARQCEGMRRRRPLFKAGKPTTNTDITR